MTTLREDLARLAEEWERIHPKKYAECIGDVRRLLLSLPPESAPAPGLRCPCGGGTLVPVPTCPACGEQWIGRAEAIALDAATEPHVIEARRAARKAAPDAEAGTKICTECQGSCHYDYTMGQAAAEGDDCLACDGTGRMPEHGVYCTACQKVFDARDLTQVLYHQTHRPVATLYVPPGRRVKDAPVPPAAPAPGEDGDRRNESNESVEVAVEELARAAEAVGRESASLPFDSTRLSRLIAVREAAAKALLARVREQDQRLMKAREALRRMLDHHAAMCSNPPGTCSTAKRAEAALKSLEGA